jgi:hypothetical protein
MGKYSVDCDEKDYPRFNDYVKPDQWVMGNRLSDDDGFKDAGFPGCQFRLPAFNQPAGLAVNVTRTGRKKFWSPGFGLHEGTWKYRVKIEFVGDCEPSTFETGWLYQHN